MRKLLSLILFLLCLLPASAQQPVGREYLFVYNLRTQFRRLNVHFTEQNDSLCLHWSFTNDEGTRGGSFIMSPQSRQHALRLNYVKPTANETISVPDDELFALLSADALSALHTEGKCRFNNTTLTLLDSKDSLLHVKDFDEGYEMWIEDNARFPLIRRMINNPVEIDWEVIEK